MRLIAKWGGRSKEQISYCRTLEIERLLSEFRTSGALNKNSSNTYDLFHVWAALTFCDFFVSSDSRAVDAIRYVHAHSSFQVAAAVEL